MKNSPNTLAPPPAATVSARPDPGRVGESLLAADAIQQALGQTIREALDLSTWEQGTGLEQLLTQIPLVIGRSIEEEERLARLVRGQVLRRLPQFPDAPAGAGVYRVPERLLRAARRNVLLAGGLTAADGACTAHDGLAATLVSIGVSLVRYDGLLNSWHSTFLRHDYDARGGDPVEELRRFLDRRAQRSPEGPGNGTGARAGRDQLTYLLRRAFMAAAERKALLQLSTRWRMGHGTPTPLELLTGSGSMELLDEVLPVLEQLFLEQTRWVFLPEHLSDRALLTLAGALEAGELALFQKGKPALEAMVGRGTYDSVRKRRVSAFAARAGEAFVVGGFRATPTAPARLFVAHAEHALEAGTIALADASLQPYRGFPLLLELAAMGARTGLGLEVFGGIVESVYARARASRFFTPARSTS